MKIYGAEKASFTLLIGAVLLILTGSIFGQSAYRKVNDFDGDGKADYAVTRNIGGQKYRYVWKSASGPDVFQFRLATDVATPGDYDGDGKTDPAIWRPGSGQSYFWVYGSQNSSITVMPWGLSTDTLVQP